MSFLPSEWRELAADSGALKGLRKTGGQPAAHAVAIWARALGERPWCRPGESVSDLKRSKDPRCA